MSYDLAVWVGPRPQSAAAADAEFARRMDEMESHLESPGKEPPVDPGIAAFVEAALRRFPEDDEDAPWASGPLITEAVGDLIYFPLTFSGAERAVDTLAEITASMDLVCYDPQLESLLPVADTSPPQESLAPRRDNWWRRWLRGG